MPEGRGGEVGIADRKHQSPLLLGNVWQFKHSLEGWTEGRCGVTFFNLFLDWFQWEPVNPGSYVGLIWCFSSQLEVVNPHFDHLVAHCNSDLLMMSSSCGQYSLEAKNNFHLD